MYAPEATKSAWPRPGFRVGSQRVAGNGIKSERLDVGPKNACYYASEWRFTTSRIGLGIEIFNVFSVDRTSSGGSLRRKNR